MVFLDDVVLLVRASRVAFHSETGMDACFAETGMDSVDRGGSHDWQLATSDPCHGVAGMGVMGGGRRSIPISRDSEELGKTS